MQLEIDDAVLFKLFYIYLWSELTVLLLQIEPWVYDESRFSAFFTEREEMSIIFIFYQENGPT